MANGAALDDDAQYTLILNDFMALGRRRLGFSHERIRSEPLGIVDLDALIAYLRTLPQPVRAPTEPRIVQPSAAQ